MSGQHTSDTVIAVERLSKRYRIDAAQAVGARLAARGLAQGLARLRARVKRSRHGSTVMARQCATEFRQGAHLQGRPERHGTLYSMWQRRAG